MDTVVKPRYDIHSISGSPLLARNDIK
ncbi:MAG: hypothetical protein ACEY3D_02480 [Rickettsia sp.]